jgi:hypothetical protein
LRRKVPVRRGASGAKIRARVAAPPASLVPVARAPAEPSAAERELSALLGQLTELEAETAAATESLNRFRDERRLRLGPAQEELHAAKRFAERISRLAVEATEWATETPRVRRAPGRTRRPAAPPWLPVVPRESEAPPWLPLKELYRTLARALHPDLAKTDAERARRSSLMAEVNAAYAREDRVLLELLHHEAEKAGADDRGPTVEARASHAERRVATLAPLVTSLERRLERLRASSSWKEYDSARVTAARGRDHFAEASYALRRESKETLARAFEGAAELERAVHALRGRKGTTPGGERLLRRAARPASGKRTSDEARRLTVELRRAASREPWRVVLALFALFGEETQEPPPGLSTLDAASARYRLLTTGMRGAPSFDVALTHLPPFLEVGLRSYATRLVLGVQVKRAELLAGIRRTLASEEVAPLARRVVSVMGARSRCASCDESVHPVHLLRVRGGDELHALVCPDCGAPFRSYRSFGAAEGLEGLASYARALGLVFEVKVAVGRTKLLLGFLEGEARRVTAKTIIARIASLYANDVHDELEASCRLEKSRKPLTKSHVVRGGAALRLLLVSQAPLTVGELEDRIRANSRPKA